VIVGSVITILAMSYKGTIQDGQIKLPPDAVLPEGAAVVVDVEVRAEDFPEWSRGLVNLIKKRDWPADMALNHDHYLHGAPKK
jgi:hypothetical protein